MALPRARDDPHDSPGGVTRLIMRERYDYTQRWARAIVEPVEAVSFVMSQKMLRTIRDRAVASSAKTAAVDEQAAAT